MRQKTPHGWGTSIQGAITKKQNLQPQKAKPPAD
jgi:hypothetical protein